MPTASSSWTAACINAIGTHEALLKDNPIYREVYYSQNKVGGDGNAQQ